MLVTSAGQLGLMFICTAIVLLSDEKSKLSSHGVLLVLSALIFWTYFASLEQDEYERFYDIVNAVYQYNFDTLIMVIRGVIFFAISKIIFQLGFDFQVLVFSTAFVTVLIKYLYLKNRINVYLTFVTLFLGVQAVDLDVIQIRHGLLYSLSPLYFLMIFERKNEIAALVLLTLICIHPIACFLILPWLTVVLFYHLNFRSAIFGQIVFLTLLYLISVLYLDRSYVGTHYPNSRDLLTFFSKSNFIFIYGFLILGLLWRVSEGDKDYVSRSLKFFFVLFFWSFSLQFTFLQSSVVSFRIGSIFSSGFIFSLIIYSRQYISPRYHRIFLRSTICVGWGIYLIEVGFR